MSDLKVRELARELGVSEKKAREMIGAGVVRSYQLGPRSTRIPRSELSRLRRR